MKKERENWNEFEVVFFVQIRIRNFKDKFHYNSLDQNLPHHSKNSLKNPKTFIKNFNIPVAKGLNQFESVSWA